MRRRWHGSSRFWSGHDRVSAGREGVARGRRNRHAEGHERAGAAGPATWGPGRTPKVVAVPSAARGRWSASGDVRCIIEPPLLAVRVEGERVEALCALDLGERRVAGAVSD